MIRTRSSFDEAIPMQYSSSETIGRLGRLLHSRGRFDRYVASPRLLLVDNTAPGDEQRAAASDRNMGWNLLLLLDGEAKKGEAAVSLEGLAAGFVASSDCLIVLVMPSKATVILLSFIVEEMVPSASLLVLLVDGGRTPSSVALRP